MSTVRKLYTFADPQLDLQIAEIVQGCNGRLSNAIPIIEEINGVKTLTGFKLDNSVASLLTLLDGQLQESQLYADLNSRIDLIDTPTTGLVAQLAGVNGRLDVVNASLSDLSQTQAYDAEATYVADDVATYSGGLYIALNTTTGNLPTDPAHWDKVGDYSSLSGTVAAQAVVLSDHATRISTAEGNITSQASTVSTLASTVAGHTSAITTEQQTRAAADAALSQSVVTLTANIGNNTAAIQNEATARANADSSAASIVSTLQTAVNGNTTSIQTQTTSINGLEGKYTVKIDNNGYVTGYGLASVSNNGIPTSEFIVVADKFAIAPVATSPSAADGSPFYCLTSPTVINGVTIPAGVYMKAAYIADASIDNAKIGDVIQSANYAPGTAGWKLDKQGNCQINGSFQGSVKFTAASEGYANLTDRPTTLAAVDAVANTKLGTISPYATDGKLLNTPFEMWNISINTVQTITDGHVGTTCLRIATAESSTQPKLIPIDPSKKYRARFWARPSATCNGYLYFALRSYLSDGSPHATDGGWLDYGAVSSLSKAAHDGNFGAGNWGEYTAIWSKVSGNWSHAGTVSFGPGFLGNHTGTSGYWDIQGLIVEEVTEVLSAATTAVWTTVSGTGKPEDDATKNQSDAATNAAISEASKTATNWAKAGDGTKIDGDNLSTVNAFITTAMIKDAQVETLKIGTNAVTVPVSYWNAADVALGISMTSVTGGATSITLSAAGKITVNFTGCVIVVGTTGAQDYPTTIVIDLYIDGSVYQTFTGAAFYTLAAVDSSENTYLVNGNQSSPLAISCSKSVAAGAHTVEIKIGVSQSNYWAGTVKSRSMVLQGAMR